MGDAKSLVEVEVAHICPDLTYLGLGYGKLGSGNDAEGLLRIGVGCIAHIRVKLMQH